MRKYFYIVFAFLRRLKFCMGRGYLFKGMDLREKFKLLFTDYYCKDRTANPSRYADYLKKAVNQH